MKTKIIKKQISKNSNIICVEIYLSECEPYMNSEQKYVELYETLQQYIQKQQIPVLTCSVNQNSIQQIESFKTLAQMLNVPLHIYLKVEQKMFDELKFRIQKELLNNALTIPYEILKSSKTVF